MVLVPMLEMDFFLLLSDYFYYTIIITGIVPESTTKAVFFPSQESALRTHADVMFLCWAENACVCIFFICCHPGCQQSKTHDGSDSLLQDGLLGARDSECSKRHPCCSPRITLLAALQQPYLANRTLQKQNGRDKKEKKKSNMHGCGIVKPLIRENTL